MFGGATYTVYIAPDGPRRIRIEVVHRDLLARAERVIDAPNIAEYLRAKCMKIEAVTGRSGECGVVTSLGRLIKTVRAVDEMVEKSARRRPVIGYMHLSGEPRASAVAGNRIAERIRPELRTIVNAVIDCMKEIRERLAEAAQRFPQSLVVGYEFKLSPSTEWDAGMWSACADVEWLDAVICASRHGPRIGVATYIETTHRVRYARAYVGYAPSREVAIEALKTAIERAVAPSIIEAVETRVRRWLYTESVREDIESLRYIVNDLLNLLRDVDRKIIESAKRALDRALRAIELEDDARRAALNALENSLHRYPLARLITRALRDLEKIIVPETA